MTKTIRTLSTAFALTLATLLGAASPALAAAPTSPDTVELTTNEAQADDGDGRFDAAVTLEGEVNINTASAAELEMLPGIGPSIAARIVSYREKHPFQQRNNIMRVKGIGQKTFAKIKDFLITEGPTTLRIAK